MKLWWAALLWVYILCIGCRADVLSLELNSDEGDPIGYGQSYSLTYDTARGSRLIVRMADYVSGLPGSVWFTAGEAVELPEYSSVDLSFGADKIPAPLQTLAYSEAERTSFASAGHPGLDVGFSGTGCNSVHGNFTINELRYDHTALISFRATFEQHCNGIAPALRGTVRYEHPPVPAIAVRDSEGRNLQSGAVIDFGSVPIGRIVTHPIFVTSAGNVDLTGIKLIKDSNETSEDFTVASLPDTLWYTFSLDATFVPSDAGARQTTLRIFSDAPDENPFVIQIRGTGRTTTLDLWRLARFGTIQNTGIAADMSDPDNDGIVNLMEFATATDPLKPTSPTGQLGVIGTQVGFTYTRAKAAANVISYSAEYSDSLNGPWYSISWNYETVINETDTVQTVRVATPFGFGGRRFARLRVTRF